MANLVLEEVCKGWKSPVLDRLSLTVEEGEGEGSEGGRAGARVLSSANRGEDGGVGEGDLPPRKVGALTVHQPLHHFQLS